MIILDGAGNMRFIFNEDKTGMIINSWFISPDQNGIDTTSFSYTIDGDCGVITPTNAEWKANWSTTYTIQDITRGKMVVYEKKIAEDCQDDIGDTTPYTRIIETWHHCEKQ